MVLYDIDFNPIEQVQQNNSSCDDMLYCPHCDLWCGGSHAEWTELYEDFAFSESDDDEYID